MPASQDRDRAPVNAPALQAEDSEPVVSVAANGPAERCSCGDGDCWICGAKNAPTPINASADVHEARQDANGEGDRTPAQRDNRKAQGKPARPRRSRKV